MKIKCVRPLGMYLTKDKIYEVIVEHDMYYAVKNDAGVMGSYFKNRFIILTNSRKQTLRRK